jgi:hopanoid biosynthesis associated RND transporter like protein HpnN
MLLANVLAGLAGRCARRPLPVLLAALLLAGAAAALAVTRLGVTTDVGTLFSASLPWKRQEAEMKALFPQFNNLIVAVVGAQEPEEADATAAGLADALRRDGAHFTSVTQPDSSPYFDQEGLLFLDTPVLTDLLDRTIDAQPFLGQLVADPSARGLFAALTLVGLGVQRGQAGDLAAFAPALRAFHATLDAALDGHPRPLSWQTLLAGPAAQLAGPYRLVLAQPKLDYGALQPGGVATESLRRVAAGLEWVKAGAAQVRVTGQVPLADEEFATVAQGAVAGLAGSVVLIALWLFLAVRSWRLMVPILLTLLFGLLLTTGFAALAVTPLNLISVAFAVLFVGIAVDFSIQFSVRYREARQQGGCEADVADAVALTARRAGGQILVASLATAAGFLAFTPTSFTGVAELGLIAGVGMIVAFACTLTALPALLAVCGAGAGPEAEGGEAGFAWAHPLDRAVRRLRVPIVLSCVLLGAAGALAVARLQFDSDPLHTKDPNTESMRTLTDLAANPITNPYTIDVLTPNLAAADALATQVGALPLVATALTLSSLVPQDQDAKLALVQDAASVLGPTLSAPASKAPVTAADIRLAARTAAGSLATALPKLPGDHPLALVAADLARMQTAPDTALLDANRALTRFLPAQIAHLRTALTARKVTAADVPPALARDWVLPDGRARVQINARPDGQGTAGLPRFVREVQAVVPDAGGSAVTVTETAKTILGAFRAAAIGAVLAIAVILAVALRRVLDAVLVLAALLLSAMLTALIAAILPMSLNFANIIALPLLLGVGVAFNIYFVMNWRAGLRQPLASPTARAVCFSALTTATAFGSLALSRHPGTASMGDLLLLSLACTLLVSLVFVPAVLSLLSGRAARHERAQRPAA